MVASHGLAFYYLPRERESAVRMLGEGELGSCISPRAIQAMQHGGVCG